MRTEATFPPDLYRSEAFAEDLEPVTPPQPLSSGVAVKRSTVPVWSAVQALAALPAATLARRVRLA